MGPAANSFRRLALRDSVRGCDRLTTELGLRQVTIDVGTNTVHQHPMRLAHDASAPVCSENAVASRSTPLA